MSFKDFSSGICLAQSNGGISSKKKSVAGNEAEILDKWNESERRLNILRTIGTHIDHNATDEEMRRWLEEVKRR